MMAFVKKKSLGQHFLASASAIKKIADTASVERYDVVLEIGPGNGALTAELLSRGARVLAVEKDNRLMPLLSQKFKKEILTGQLMLIHEDILDFSPLRYMLHVTSYKLISNIPYYLTGAILKKFIGGASPPSMAVLLLQKEVAERIVARDGKESILSLSIKAYGTPRLVQKIPRGAFRPPPKVDSAILAIEEITKKFFSGIDEQNFFAVVKKGFSQKRKLLLNSLDIPGENGRLMMRRLGIGQKSRPENLALEDWQKITLYLKKKSLKTD